MPPTPPLEGSGDILFFPLRTSVNDNVSVIMFIQIWLISVHSCYQYVSKQVKIKYFQSLRGLSKKFIEFVYKNKSTTVVALRFLHIKGPFKPNKI